MQPKPHEQPRLRALIANAEYALAEGPHPERARLDVETLLLHLLRRADPARNKAWLMTHWSSQAMPEVKAELEALVERRKTGEPLQYITGNSEFFGLPFSVGPGVLIPRPETEHLVEEVIRLAANIAGLRIADIGTGSGIIAVALANALPQAQITAIDISPQALKIARHNAAVNQVESRITFLEGDLLQPLIHQQFEIIASNPPYIPLTDRDSLSVEVRDYEPASALFAGDDGLAIYRRLIPEAVPHLVPNGWLLLEIGYNQQPAIEKMLQANRYTSIHFIDDYQAIPRVAVAQQT